MPSATFGGAFLHPTLPEMAAAYLFHISQAHGFVDGNKRAALAAALAFLSINGYELDAAPDDLYGLCIAVAAGDAEQSGRLGVFRQARSGAHPAPLADDFFGIQLPTTSSFRYTSLTERPLQGRGYERAPAASPRWIPRLEPRAEPTGIDGQADRPPQPLLVDPRREHRLFGLAIWSVVATRLNKVGFPYTTDQLFQLVALPGAGRVADALPLYLRGAALRRAELDDRERALDPDPRLGAGPFRRAAGDAVLADGARRRRPRAWAAETSPPAWPTSRSSTPTAKRAGRSASTPPAATSASARCSSWCPS